MEQKKESRKRRRRSDSQETTRHTKAWTLKEFGGKTVWDWMQLHIVPIALSLITLAFTWQQDARQQEIEDQRAQVERAVEKQRAQAEREIQEERADHATLEAYLDQMGTLLLNRDLRASEEKERREEIGAGEDADCTGCAGAYSPGEGVEVLE